MSELAQQTALTILGTYGYLWLLQLLAWPVVKKLFGSLPDEGWAMTRFLGIVGTSLGLWETAHFGFAVNTVVGIKTGLLLMVLAGIILTKKEGVRWLLIKRETIKVVALEEYLFVVGFVGICLVRSYLPNLDSLEKFMDYGFIVRYMNSPTLPAIDMWQAGSYINYYSFGHYWASVLIRFLGVSSEVGYNLVLGFIAGQSLVLAFLACLVLGKKRDGESSVMGGLLGSLVVVFGSNSHTLWYILKNRSLDKYWYADATRFIYHTIHEFPSYSLVVSDLHGHLFDLPIALTFIIVFYLVTQKERVVDLVIMGSLFAIMMMTNTWDVPIYGLLICVWLGAKLIKEPHVAGKWLQKLLVIFGSMTIISIPWWLKFQPISSGVMWVSQRSPLWQLGVLWGVAMAINVVAWVVSKKSETVLLIRSLIVTSVLLILIPEVVYAKDIYPDHPRANTMFKLTYQACVMVGVILGTTMNRLTEMMRERITWGRVMLMTFCLLIFCSLIIYPTVSFPAYYENFTTFRGLKGETWLQNIAPEKYEVIQFLRKNNNGLNLIEAVGDSYTEYNVVSAYTGIPTIEGWRVHEWLWRGGYEQVAKREQLVKEVYEGSSLEKSQKVLADYKVGWILVGQDEETTYLINHQKLRLLGSVVWEMGDSYLIKVR